MANDKWILSDNLWRTFSSHAHGNDQKKKNFKLGTKRRIKITIFSDENDKNTLNIIIIGKLVLHFLQLL